MEDKRIPDSLIRASSVYSQYYQAANGRLNLVGAYFRAGGWLAKRGDLNPWLEVNFGSKVTISKIATQGMHGYSAWVKTFTVGYSDGGETFAFYNKNQTFKGNEDRNTIEINILKPAITARVIRIYPQTWRWYTALRAELYGCRPVSQGNMTGEAISAQTVRVTWQIKGNSRDNSLPCGFKVGYRVRTAQNNESWVTQSFSATATEYTINNLLAYTTYEVYVEALNDACSGRFSPTVLVTTHEKAPSAPPQNVTVAEVTYNSVVLQWLPPPRDRRNGRIFQYSITAWRANRFTNSSISRNYSHDNKFLEQQGRLPDLESGTEYAVTLTARNIAGSSPASIPLLFETLQGPTEPAVNPDEKTEAILPTTQESTSARTIVKEKQKDAERTVSSPVLVGASVALAVGLVVFLLVAVYVFNKRRKNKKKEPQQETPGVMIYNNDISLSRAAQQMDIQNLNLPLSPASNRKIWQKQDKLQTDHSYYNSEEIAKQNNRDQVNSFNDEVYSYAKPEDFRANYRNQKENDSSQSFIERNPVYDIADHLRSTNGKTDLQYIQENPIYLPASDQPSLTKHTQPVLSKNPICDKTRKLSVSKVGPPLTQGESLITPEEPEYYVLEGPDPSTPTNLNSFSDDVYDVLYNNDTALLEDKGSCDYDVIWCSTKQCESESKNPVEFYKPSTCKGAVNSSKTYEKLWLAKTDDKPEFRNAEGVVYDSTYETVGDSFT